MEWFQNALETGAFEEQATEQDLEMISFEDKSAQRVINSPRPILQSGARFIQQSSQDEMYDEIPAKKRKFFRRALKGLSMRSANGVAKIEDIRLGLLEDTEGLKVSEGLKTNSHPRESYSGTGTYWQNYSTIDLHDGPVMQNTIKDSVCNDEDVFLCIGIDFGTTWVFFPFSIY